MNMFSGGSSRQNIKLVKDDQQIDPFGLDAKIEKESEWMEGESMWRDRTVRLTVFIASKKSVFIASKKITWMHHCAIDD